MIGTMVEQELAGVRKRVLLSVKYLHIQSDAKYNRRAETQLWLGFQPMCTAVRAVYDVYDRPRRFEM